MFITYAAQILSALVMFFVGTNAIMVFYKMIEGTDERNSIPYLVINIIMAIAAIFVYVYLNYLM